MAVSWTVLSEKQADSKGESKDGHRGEAMLFTNCRMVHLPGNFTVHFEANTLDD